MTEPESGPESAPRTWPPTRELATHEVVAATCTACGQHWRVHRSMAGYSLRCGCGAWVSVPVTEPARLDGAHDALPAPAEPGHPVVPRGAAVPALQRWDGRPLARGPDGTLCLREASVTVQRRWIDRTVLELVAMMAAFVVPALVLQFALSGPARAFWMPLESLASSLLVLVVAHSDRTLAFGGLRAAPPRFLLEALLAACAALLLAAGWLAVVHQLMPDADHHDLTTLQAELGVAMTLFVVALCPALFEELAFRGLIQGRLAVLMGPVQGALVGGVAFALAHGVTLGFPLHAGLGVYLAFLRLRSGSLWPGILLHLSYNAGVVLLL